MITDEQREEAKRLAEIPYTQRTVTDPELDKYWLVAAGNKDDNVGNYIEGFSDESEQKAKDWLKELRIAVFEWLLNDGWTVLPPGELPRTRDIEMGLLRARITVLQAEKDNADKAIEWCTEQVKLIIQERDTYRNVIATLRSTGILPEEKN